MLYVYIYTFIISHYITSISRICFIRKRYLRREKRKPGVEERRAEKRKREQEGRTRSGGSQGEVEMGRGDWKGVVR